ncbi:hypothetical protein [Glycomyces albidus]|jgi:hypothetical protein|uniref:Uncharacterized protein n=1 Tax=Glycomyces albidus TaxID=2656774 RepID=A0A6L5G941_9ACTN|nr:hypothetical protein [Glycomyces albidus]MQM26103.1 hypothetical protein [Glycomyces albidus]
MSTALAKRRYRLGTGLFLGSARWLRWILIAWIVLTPVLSAVFADVVEIGLWAITATVFQWFVACTAGIMLYQGLPGMLANGVTRREVTTAYLVFGALASAGTAAVVTAGFAAEHALLSAVAQPAGSWSADLAAGARYLLITPIYFFTGALIGAAALRFGGSHWFSALVLVAAAGHYAGVLALEYGFSGGPGTVAAWAAIGLAVIAILVAGTAAALRDIPVRANRA